jgi:hypothetical protein
VQIGSIVETFPASNNSYVRGLHYRFRLQIQALQEERQALLQQLEDAPEGGALNSAATNVKLTTLIDQNIALKEESAALVQEKVLLQDQMKHFKDSGSLAILTARKTCSSLLVELWAGADKAVNSNGCRIILFITSVAENKYIPLCTPIHRTL